MKDAVRDALNRQVNRELYAAYLYLAMSAHFDAASLDGFASWMRAQSREEVEHAMRLFGHLSERGEKVELTGVDQPPAEFGSPLEVFEAALAHEEKVTEQIHEIYDLVVEEHDHPAQMVLEWFVTEQVEEEDTIGRIVEQVRMAGENEAALLMLDRELGTRGGQEGE